MTKEATKEATMTPDYKTVLAEQQAIDYATAEFERCKELYDKAKENFMCGRNRPSELEVSLAREVKTLIAQNIGLEKRIRGLIEQVNEVWDGRVGRICEEIEQARPFATDGLNRLYEALIQYRSTAFPFDQQANDVAAALEDGMAFSPDAVKRLSNAALRRMRSCGYE